MTHTPAEIAAGRALHRQEQDIVPEDWDALDADDQAPWIECAMVIVRAHNELADITTGAVVSE